MGRRLSQWFLVGGFMIMLSLPLVVALISPDREISENEKRKLAPLPALTTLSDDPARYREAFVSYLEDHIGFRDAAIELNSKVKVIAFNISPSPLAILGRDRWIFFWGQNSRLHSAERDFKGDYPVPLSLLDSWYINHMAVTEDLERRGVRYLLAIAPNKQSIYPEYLPFRVRSKAGRTILDQFDDYVADKQIKGWLNFKDDFLEMKPVQQMYLRSDSHWNEFGFLHGYRRLVEWSRRSNPAVPPGKSDDQLDFRPQLRRGDLVYVVGFASRFIEPITSVYAEPECASIKEDLPLNQYGYEEDGTAYLYRCESGRGKMLFLHDSFGIPVEPLLAEHYAETVASSNGSPPLLDGLVTSFDPDYFIQLRVEREFASLFPAQPDLTDAYIANLFEQKADQRLGLSLDPADIICNNCTASVRDDALAIDATSNDPFILFDQDSLPDFTNSITLKLELTTPTRNTAAIYYATDDASTFSEQKVITVKLKPGKNTHYLRVVAAEPIRALRLDPGNVNTSYLLHNFSVVANGNQ